MEALIPVVFFLIIAVFTLAGLHSLKGKNEEISRFLYATKEQGNLTMYLISIKRMVIVGLILGLLYLVLLATPMTTDKDFLQNFFKGLWKDKYLVATILFWLCGLILLGDAKVFFVLLDLKKIDPTESWIKANRLKFYIGVFVTVVSMMMISLHVYDLIVQKERMNEFRAILFYFSTSYVVWSIYVMWGFNSYFKKLHFKPRLLYLPWYGFTVLGKSFSVIIAGIYLYLICLNF